MTDYGQKMKDVHCSPEQVMDIRSAKYGDFDTNGVFSDDENFDGTCNALASCQVKSRCNGHRSCELTINSNLLPSKSCSATSKQIYTKYNCKDAYDSSTIITTGKVHSSEISLQILIFADTRNGLGKSFQTGVTGLKKTVHRSSIRGMSADKRLRKIDSYMSTKIVWLYFLIFYINIIWVSCHQKIRAYHKS